ncbi:cupredoxin family copper-binding protein [Sphingomonas bacterium]|uniref:cupredoxin domain-containing protein n=1 Tax=Sphingomonas bacterium TaxID=1895847 RepID=UPI00262AFDF4|nr:cupredoxin family copper-binding protein [Sphingomonas bacterium]MDB5680101.1 MauN [Sphingomonas bacterium]
MNRILFAAGIAALAVPATIAISAPAPAPAPAKVHISNFTFGPKALTVKVGQTVTWTNDDDIPHTVVATDKSFRSKVLDTGQSFSFTFTKAGAFAYFCSLHPMMTGKIVVAAR